MSVRTDRYVSRLRSMAEQASITGVGGRFVTEADLQVIKERQRAEWDAAYERIGQKPPEVEQAPYDPRTLFEKLEEQKAIKEAEWAEYTRLSAQYRGLDEEESAFLQRMRDEEKNAEDEREREVSKELERFKESRATAAPPIASSSKPVAPVKKPSKPVTAAKKPSQKSLLAAAIRKPASNAAKQRTSASTLAAKQRPE